MTFWVIFKQCVVLAWKLLLFYSPKKYCWRPKWRWVHWVEAKKVQIRRQWRPTMHEFGTVFWSFHGVGFLAFVKPSLDVELLLHYFRCLPRWFPTPWIQKKTFKFSNFLIKQYEKVYFWTSKPLCILELKSNVSYRIQEIH